MKILVTGANGYIGSHLCKVLYDRNHEVWAYDIEDSINTSKVSPFIIPWTVISKSENFDVVVHLGAYISVGESVSNPKKYYTNNILSTLNALEILNYNHFIFASTAGAFDPQSPYAYSKIVCEDLIRQIAKNYTIYRFFNVSGSDGIFQQINEATHLIRVAAEVAAGKRKELVVHGKNYDTPDGTCIRDYVHVLDLCEIIEANLDNPSKVPYENIGSGKGYSVLEVVETMKLVTKVNFPVKFGSRREGDPAKLVAKNPVGFYSRNLEDMCKSTYEIVKAW